MQQEPKSPSPERATVAGGFEAAGGSPEQIAYENAEAALDAITVFENGDSARIDATVAAYVHEANLSPTAEEVDKEQAAAVGVLEAVGDEGAVETVHALNGVSVETLGGSLAVVAHGHEADEIKGLMARMDRALAESGHGHTETPNHQAMPKIEQRMGPIADLRSGFDQGGSLPNKFTPILDTTPQQLAGNGHQRPIPVDMPPGFNTLSRDVNEQTHRYTSERLQKQPDVRDDNGRPRPTYEINGHTVTFRNRQEVVVIGDLPTVSTYNRG